MQLFKTNTLLGTARRNTGLSDFGPDDFMPGLNALIDGINAKAEISEDRWGNLFDFFVRALENRLRFTKDLSDHPEILQQELLPPVVILPLPRTGSTKLHRMLGASGSFQTLPFWQAYMFSRIAGHDDDGVAERRRRAKEFEEWVYATVPDMLKGHPMFVDEPEEEQVLHECTFRSARIAAWFNAPIYSEWLSTQDMAPSYDYLLQQLKYLQWQFHRDARKPWLLKSPTNFGFEKLLLDNFGRELKIICPHRDPVNVVCSISRVSEYYRALFTDVDQGELAQEMGQFILTMFSQAARQHLSWRDENPGIGILDLSYADIDEKPMEALRSVYGFLNLELTPDIEASISRWEQDKGRKQFARNKYSAEEFGLSDAQIHQAFAPYMERFHNFL